MEEKVQKINFFERLMVAIFKLERYSEFLLEKRKVAFIFFVLMIIMLSFTTSVFQSLKFYKMANKGIAYIKTELPDFKYENDLIKFDFPFEAYDSEYDFRMFVDTNDLSEDKLSEYKSKFSLDDSGVIILKDKLFFVIETNVNDLDVTNNDFIELNYSDYSAQIQALNITDKSSLVDYLNSTNILAFFVPLFLELFFINFLTNLILYSFMLIITMAFGYIASVLCGVRVSLSPMYILAVYSSALSITISAIYHIINILTGFVIKNYDLVYLLITYAYMIAAILMIKYELIKQGQVLSQSVKIEKKEDEEERTEEQEEKKDKEEKENKSKENTDNKETDEDNRRKI